ncbi:MAG: ROK family protein [Clostridia bacterium]|nr:ROK family protein [Clostridia bacterium]
MKILGIDLGGSRVKLAIVDAGCVEEIKIFPIRCDAPVRSVLKAVEDQAVSMAGIAGCRGIGFAFPGIVDMGKQRVLCSNGKYADAAETDFAGWARERFGLRLILTNDAAAALCGEMAYGAGRGCDSAVLMMVGTGIGTAACSQGRVLTGKHGTMGILGGHIAISFDHPRPCTCGNVGCLEAYAGTWALPGLAREHPGFGQSMLKNAERIDYRALAAGCEAGDAVCGDVFRNACRALCAGAANLVHAYDPERLILSGGAAHIGALRTAIQEHLDRYCWTPWGHVRVTSAENPEASVALGLSSLFEKRENGALSEQL